MPAEHSTFRLAEPPAYRFDALFVAGLIALCALIVATLAWTRPTTSAADIGYQQMGQVTYSAPTAASSVYGGGGVATGQPVYTNAVNDLAVDYTYRLVSSSHPEIQGTEQLVATIDNGQGVVRSFDLQPSTPFRGNGFRASGTLHLSDLQSAAASFEQMATVDGAAAYVVSISPRVAVTGHLADQSIRAVFDQAAKFNYRPATADGTGVFSPIRPPGAASADSSTSAAASSGPISTTASGSVSRPGGSPATLFFGLPVFDARIGAPAILAGALLALFFVGRRLIRDLTARDERRRISARYGSTMVGVDALPVSPSSTVELATFDGLLKVARKLGCPLLHHADRTSVYAVVDGTTVYRYVADADEPALASFGSLEPMDITGHESNGHLVHDRS